LYILGISAFYHDSAACLVHDGRLLSAVQEERLTRVKNDESFPKNAILYCLAEAGVSAEEIDYVVFYEKPFLKFERILETFFAFAPRGLKSFLHAIPSWLKEKIFQKRLIISALQESVRQDVDWGEKLLFAEHHLSHAASAFFPSPFHDAVVLTIDGVGEWDTTSIWLGEGNNLKKLKSIHFPHSLGLLYSAFTYYLGFKVNSGEYKVMGLAPYGEPKYADLIRNKMLSIKADGSFELKMEYFGFCTDLKMTSQKFHNLFGLPARIPDSKILAAHMDIAASIQTVIQEMILALAKKAKIETGKENLCLAGGVALNCVANGLIDKSNLFKEIWVQPAAGDAGGAIGAALSYWYLAEDREREVELGSDSMCGAFLGPCYTEDEIENHLKKVGAIYLKLNFDELLNFVAEKISQGLIIGWMQGRLEFGPRALGARSILADPRSPHMQNQINKKIKFRESFRPFAPAVLLDQASNWFDLDSPSPYMSLVAGVKKQNDCGLVGTVVDRKGLEKLGFVESPIPSTTHVDGSSRVQTVDEKQNPLFYRLIDQFFQKTGCPILINTSFNVRGEPIVCTPSDAFRCFMKTEMDILVMDKFLIEKSKNGFFAKHDILNQKQHP